MYMGLKLRNPLVASASPLSKNIDILRRMEESGLSAVVMYSLFEEQVTHEMHQLDHFLTRGTNSYAEAMNYFPDLTYYNIGPEAYLEHLYQAKQRLSIPIIGSLNGISAGGWVEYAENIEQAGADALELNIYYLSTDSNLEGKELEETYLTLVREVRQRIKIPLAVKLSPFFSSIPNMAQKFVDAGANGLVLFNRFYQPDFDLEHLEVVPSLELSSSADLRLPLRWIAIMYKRIQTDFALTSGIHTATDVVKAIMAGASVAMTASELLARGVERAAHIIDGLDGWLEENEYESITQMRGSMSQAAVAEPAAFERANYLKVLNSIVRY
jgi:dihydroorotate dehydrogenase (fumarate)